MDELFKKQVCSIELSIELEKLGVEQISYFYWEIQKGVSRPYIVTHDKEIILSNGHERRNYSAFTCAELGELLLEEVEKYSVYLFPDNLFNGIDDNGTAEADTEANLRAKMLIRAIQLKS